MWTENSNILITRDENFIIRYGVYKDKILFIRINTKCVCEWIIYSDLMYLSKVLNCHYGIHLLLININGFHIKDFLKDQESFMLLYEALKERDSNNE